MDVGGWELRLSRPVDVVYDIPWAEVDNDWLRDIICDVLSGPDSEVHEKAMQDLIGESEWEHAICAAYQDGDKMMHTFVAVWL